MLWLNNGDNTMTQQWECWAYVSEDGKIVSYAGFEEEDVWAIVCGTDDELEIQVAKQRGARVIRVRIEEIGE